MRKLALLTLLVPFAFAGDCVDEIKWLKSKEAFEKAKKTKQWVLVYKEWPR